MQRKRRSDVASTSVDARKRPKVWVDRDDDDDEENTSLDFERASRRRNKLKDALAASESDSDEEQSGIDMFDDTTNAEKKLPSAQKLTGEDTLGEVQHPADFDDHTAGVKIEPFNMFREMEEGAFDEAGTYVAKKDENQRHDSWMTGISKEDIEKAAEAHRRREKQAEQREKEKLGQTNDILPNDKWGLLKSILGMIQPQETVTDALGRLSSMKKEATEKRKGSKKSWKKQQQQEMDDTEYSEIVAKIRKEIELLTECCCRMMGLGQMDVYDITYEAMILRLQQSNRIADDWRPCHPLNQQDHNNNHSDNGHHDIFSDHAIHSSHSPMDYSDQEHIEWRYRWQHSGDDSELFGPFQTFHMRSWAEQGTFNSGILLQKIVNGEPSSDAFVQSIGQEFLTT